jgi:hypothetical protein
VPTFAALVVVRALAVRAEEAQEVRGVELAGNGGRVESLYARFLDGFRLEGDDAAVPFSATVGIEPAVDSRRAGFQPCGELLDRSACRLQFSRTLRVAERVSTPHGFD